MNVAHVIVNNLGGITSLVQNLILYNGSNAPEQELVVLDIAGNPNKPAQLDRNLAAVTHHFHLNPVDNWYYTYGRLAKMLGKSDGVLVSNDQYDLIMLQAFNIPRKVVQLVHDPYNLELAIRFHAVVDRFIAHSRYIYEELIRLMPSRSADIIHLPYGIPLSPPPLKQTAPADVPLRLVFVGRHDKAKGVYDLFEIFRMLENRGIKTEWLILGSGPESENLRRQWQHVACASFETPEAHAMVLERVASCDIMVFPTRFEGFPVALVECMSQGCVPVVTDLSGGIQELVQNGKTGYRCEMGNNNMFAEAIIRLNENRVLLTEMKQKAIQQVIYNHDATKQSPAYQQIFQLLALETAVPRHHAVNRKIGSRLDQPFLPSGLVRQLRKWQR